ncbi:MAG: YkgJ family cysteine cluster protein [Dehalococcoidia bacterium]|nr:YkgJ family cysteine cluster protein [Dehalococcoidia bacterium]
MIEGEEMVIKEEIPVHCFRCGICCTIYQPPLYPEDIENIALGLGISKSECICRYAEHAPTKEGYLLKRMEKGCIFLAWDEEGKACCTIYSFRPKACREWIPSLSKPECLEGLIKLKSEGQLMLLGKLFDSEEDQETFCSSLKNALLMGGF